MRAKEQRDQIGYETTAELMRTLAFTALELQFRPTTIELADGLACEWTTVGDVPRGPGIYAFTAGGDDDLRVMYVGLTEELWMVTKGRLPPAARARASDTGGLAMPASHVSGSMP